MCRHARGMSTITNHTKNSKLSPLDWGLIGAGVARTLIFIAVSIAVYRIAKKFFEHSPFDDEW